MYDVNVGNPTVADDMVMISFSSNGLNAMLQICYEYSKRWRYDYNSSKCSVIVFNEYGNHKFNRQFKLRQNIIIETESYTHLGVKCNAFLSTKDSAEDACTKLRGTLLSICNSGIHPSSVSPITMRTIYTAIVLPKSLYGSELWTTLNQSDIFKLERAHRFCVKFIQQLSKNTCTDFSLASLDLTCIETIIDHKKLHFFGQLCRLPNKYLAKQVVNHRLIRFANYDVNQYMGFIPEVYRLLKKYDLCEYLNIYLHTGCFPSKYVWKAILKRHVFLREKRERHERLQNTSPVGQLLASILHVDTPSKLWLMLRDKPCMASVYRGMNRIIGTMTSRTYLQICSKCDLICDNMTLHNMCYCREKEKYRQQIWVCLLRNHGLAKYIEFIRSVPITQCEILLQNAIDAISSPNDNNLMLARTLCMLSYTYT